MQIDPFFQVPQHTVSTSIGNVLVPVLLKEGDYNIALFTVDRDRTQDLLENTGMAPAWVLGNKTIAVLVMADFTVCSVRPYRMISLSLPVTRQQGFQPIAPWKEVFSRADQRHMGFYLASSTVDNVQMTKVGAEIWGHPKSHANIEYDLKGSHIECNASCSYSGEDLLRFSGSGMRFFRIPSLSYNMFSLVGNQLQRALLNTRGMYNVHLPMGFRLQVGNGNQLMTQQLRQLNLNGKRPLIVLSTSQFQGRYNEGATVEQVEPTIAAPCNYNAKRELEP